MQYDSCWQLVYQLAFLLMANVGYWCFYGHSCRIFDGELGRSLLPDCLRISRSLKIPSSPTFNRPCEVVGQQKLYHPMAAERDSAPHFSNWKVVPAIFRQPHPQIPFTLCRISDELIVRGLTAVLSLRVPFINPTLSVEFR